MVELHAKGVVVFIFPNTFYPLEISWWKLKSGVIKVKPNNLHQASTILNPEHFWTFT